MAEAQDQQDQQHNQPSPRQPAKAPTWEEETASFHKPGEAPAPKEDEDDDAKDAGKAGDDAGGGGNSGDGSDAAVGAESGAGKPKAADAKPDGEAEKPGADAEDELPGWLKDRVARAGKKADAADASRQADLDRIAELEETLAAERAAKPKAEEKPLVKPKAADFDTVEDYEAARDTYDTAVKARDAAAAEAAKKPEPKKAEEKKPDAKAAPALPLGLTQADMDGAAEAIRSASTKELVVQLGDSKIVPILTPVMLVHLSEQPKDRVKDMAQFIIKSPKTMALIGALPDLRQAAALERAFIERPKAKASKAPEPGSRVNAGAGHDISTESYSDFEKRRNAEEAGERYR